MIFHLSNSVSQGEAYGACSTTDINKTGFLCQLSNIANLDDQPLNHGSLQSPTVLYRSSAPRVFTWKKACGDMLKVRPISFS